MSSFSYELDPITAIGESMSLQASARLVIQHESNDHHHRIVTDLLSPSGMSLCTHTATYLYFDVVLDNLPVSKVEAHSQEFIHRLAISIHKAKFWASLPVAVYLEPSRSRHEQRPESRDTDFSIKVVPLQIIHWLSEPPAAFIRSVTFRLAFSERDGHQACSASFVDGSDDPSEILISHANRPITHIRRGKPPVRDCITTPICSLSRDISAACLISDAVLRALIGGRQCRRTTGVRIMKYPDQRHTLARINAAIWSPGYTERMQSQQKHIGNVSSAISNIARSDIQSPSMMHKLAQLRSKKDTASLSSDRCPLRETIQDQLFSLMHKNTCLSKLSRSLPAFDNNYRETHWQNEDVLLDSQEELVLESEESEDAESLLSWSSNIVDDLQEDLLASSQDDWYSMIGDDDPILLDGIEIDVDLEDGAGDMDSILLSDDATPILDDLDCCDAVYSNEGEVQEINMLI